MAVGTIDQAMLSVMQTKHSHMRAACLSRNLLVIDEVHASDNYMRGIMQALVRNHTMKGGYALLMSATLGSSARSSYLEQPMPDIEDAKDIPYPCISTKSGTADTGSITRQKEVRIRTMPAGDTPLEIAKEALLAQQSGAKVLVIRNTVRRRWGDRPSMESICGQAERDNAHCKREASGLSQQIRLRRTGRNWTPPRRLHSRQTGGTGQHRRG